MLAMAGVLMTSCQDDFVEGTITRPAEVGDVILFGASANFENANPNVRTEYSGEEVGGKESIWWVPNKDRVQIYCAEAISASDDHSAHYVVKGDAQSTGKDNASTTDKVEQNYLERLHESSLQWGEGSDANGTHTFYGMYPSQFMFRNDDNSTAIDPTLVEGITMSGTIVKGYVHNEQIASAVTKNGNNYVAKPDMRYAYMVAKTSTTRQQAITETNGVVQGVSLNFYPLVTALQVILTLPTSSNAAAVNPVTIGRVSISAPDVAGSFSADLSAWDGASAYTTNANTGTSKLDEIYMRINYTDANGLTMPVTLKAGESLTFTVFLKPTANVDSIKIGFASDFLGQTTKYKELGSKETPAGIQVRKKNIISNLRLPVALEAQKVDYSHWMMQMEDNTTISGISLPGTAHSFSYGVSDNNYKAQDLNFDEQWKAGIRAFEVASDRPSSASTSLANQNVQTGKQNTDVTISGAVTLILDKLAANPFETAMLVFTYQPVGANPSRNGASYMQSLMTYINTIDSKKLIRFEPNLTLGNYKENDLDKDAEGKVTGVKTNAESDGARGKLMIVVRPNSMYEKDGAGDDEVEIWTAIKDKITGDNASEILVVNGCGTGKDKWGARGYTINGNRAADISNSANTYIEQFMNSQNNPLWTTNGTTYGSGEVTSGSNKIYRAPQYNGTNLETVAGALKFNYTTNVSGMDCWFQEWQRVLPSALYKAGGRWNNWYTYSAIQWFESYQEKLSNAKATFDMAISGKYDGNTEGHPKYVFINSLDGYLAGSDETESLIPSTGSAYGGGYGNTPAQADKINPDFYAYVNQRISSAVAPTGIVFMDFVSNTPTKSGGTADPAYWLPQLIVNNNTFKAGIAPGGSGDGTDDEEDGW